jgi:hypothetical protein
MDYDTRAEAEAWLDGLRMRWFGYDMARVVTIDTPRNQPIDPPTTSIRTFGSRDAVADAW